MREIKRENFWHENCYEACKAMGSDNCIQEINHLEEYKHDDVIELVEMGDQSGITRGGVFHDAGT